jgi:sugar/nucleoside kinase (ribokinase family)
MKARHRVVAVGDICVDIKTDPLSDFTLGDRQFRVKDLSLSVGGNSANFCLGTARLGLDTSINCCLGRDAISGWLRERMTESGIKVVVKRHGKGIAAITYGLTHTDGTRQMITFNGPNLQFGERDIDYSLVKSASHLHRSGFWWTPKLWGEPTRKLMRFAQDNNIETSFDVGTDPEGWPEERRAHVYKALESTGIFFGNQTEITNLAQEKGLKKGADALLGMGVKMVVAHLGPEGSAVCTKREMIKVPAFKVTPLNPIGSGDIFNAGFTYARLQRWPLRRCALFANACAAYYIERIERPYPNESAVKRRFGV